MSLAAVLLCSFFLRVVGVSWGLPHVYHQDEPILVNHAMAVGAGDWNPHFFALPPFLIYFLFFAYTGLFAVWRLAAVVNAPHDFAVRFLSDPTVFYTLGRLLAGTLFGTAAVAATAALGRRFFSKDTALAAALFLAVAYLPVAHSHYIYVDTALSFACVVLCLLFMEIMEKPAVRNYAFAGAVFGWAVSVKYTAAYLAPLFLWADTVAWGNRVIKWRLLSLAVFASAALFVFAVIAPFTFLDWANFWSQIRTQSGAETAPGFWHHLVYSLGNGLGWPLLVLAGIGLVKPAFARWQSSFVGLAVLTYYGVNAVFSQHFARYMLPIAPLVCLLAGLGWVSVTQKIRSVFVKGALLAFIVFATAAPTVYADWLFLQKDTRTQCLEWFDQNVPAGSRVAMDKRFFGPRLGQTQKQIQAKLPKAPTGVKSKRIELEIEATRSKKTYEVYTMLPQGESEEGRFLFEGPFVAADSAAIERLGARYVVLNYFEPLPAVEGYAASRWKRVASFTPYRDGALKPTDPWSSTAAPDSLKECFRRARLGPALAVYEVTQR